MRKTNEAPVRESGIIVLNAENRNEATVVAVSNKVDEVSVGDKIILADKCIQAPRVVDKNDYTYIVNVEDIIAVLES